MTDRKQVFLFSRAHDRVQLRSRAFSMVRKTVVVSSTPAPNLNWDTREMLEKRLDDPARTVDEALSPRVEEGLTQRPIYGEKNLTYGHFVPHMYARFDCRFVLLVRDGTEVAPLLIDRYSRTLG
ncbi:MAG: hypothetical protein ACI9BW_001150 [Gammaproteobacteria bacterium]